MASVPMDTMASVPAPGLALASLPFCDETICKTPVEWVDSALKHAFGNDHVMLERCQHPDKLYSLGESHSDLDVVVMDCVVSRGRPVGMNNNKKGNDATRDARVQACLLEDVDAAVNLPINCIISVKNDSDEFYRVCIVVPPQVGVFYCHSRERCSLLTGVLNLHVPMDIYWLQLWHDSPNNCFGNGSYLSRLTNAKKCSVWKYLPFSHKFVAIPQSNPGAETKITCEIDSPHKAADG